MNQLDSPPKEYATKDIYVAASLLATGLNLIDIRRFEKQFTFVFPSTPEIETLVSGYWNNTLRVDAHKLFTAFKDIKNRMYNQV